ncbi:hypothetical protein [Streptomyces achromogenes]|uniref:hypothetical protein n=1 Tax=Streptomyces achromogenes TaxID=67255 RepID=UPI0012FE93E4|nr:hypothetical protein [Streptomyces achromogenes]
MAVQISEEQVRQAEARAVQAEEVRDQAARRLDVNPYSDVAAMEHSEAARTAAQLRANAREVRQAYERQVEEERRRRSRPELEKAAAAEIRAAGREMEGLEKGLVGAVAQAEAALVALLDAGVTYNAGVVRHAQALAGAGLDRRGGESGGEETSLGEYLLRVKGREFRRMDPGSVAGWLLRRVAEERLGQFHHLVGALFPAHMTAEDQAEWLVEKASKGQ